MNADTGIIIKEGFLVKRGHVRHNWKTRWFKLSDTSLRYYKSKKDTVPHGRIPLRQAKLSMYQSDHKHDKDREFVMQIQTWEGITYPIQAPSNEELKIWMEFIRDIIEHLELEHENNYSTNLLENNATSDLSSAEILGSYIDAYGGIKRENRTVKGIERKDGFSGIGLRVWMEHTMGLEGSEADITVSELQRMKLLELVDGESDPNPFSDERYYTLSSDEDALKKMVEGDKTQSGSIKSNKLGDDNSAFLPPDILNAADFPTAVLPLDLPPGEIVKRGVLFKKGHVVRNWKARCFVLQRFPATLSYFDPSKKNPKVLNSLSLHGASVFSVGRMAAQAALGMRNPPEHLFCVKIAAGTLYIIMASSDREKYGWIDEIQPLCRKIKTTAEGSRSSSDSES